MRMLRCLPLGLQLYNMESHPNVHQSGCLGFRFQSHICFLALHLLQSRSFPLPSLVCSICAPISLSLSLSASSTVANDPLSFFTAHYMYMPITHVGDPFSAPCFRVKLNNHLCCDLSCRLSWTDTEHGREREREREREKRRGKLPETSGPELSDFLTNVEHVFENLGGSSANCQPYVVFISPFEIANSIFN
jgi:hypothetical protein